MFHPRDHHHEKSRQITAPRDAAYKKLKKVVNKKRTQAGYAPISDPEYFFHGVRKIKSLSHNHHVNHATRKLAKLAGKAEKRLSQLAPKPQKIKSKE